MDASLNKLKVLHVLNSLGFGGTEFWLLEIVKNNNGRVKFDFLLTSGNKSELDDQFVSFGCKLHYAEFSYKKIVFFSKSFNRILKEEGYDIIHNHEDFVAGWHWVLTMANWPKTRIAHSHNSLVYIDNYRKNSRRKLFYKLGKILSGLFSTHITGTSNMLLDQLGYNSSFYQRKRIEPLYCGTNQDKFKYDSDSRIAKRKEFGIEEDELLIIFVGRIDCPRPNDINHKNPTFAVDLAAQLIKINNKIKFIFVGEKGELGDKIEQDFSERNCSQNVFFLGKRQDVPELMSASDLFLFTSIVEPFGLVLVEAQYSGLKVISSDIITNEIIEKPGLFTLLNLGEQGRWIEAIQIEYNCLARDKNNNRVFKVGIHNSKFSIEASYNRLLKIYKK
jgi:glycosyltransferase involved in cell wall biosynthesis